MKIISLVLLCYVLTFGQGLIPGQFGTTTKADTAYDTPYKAAVDAYFKRVTLDGGTVVTVILVSSGVPKYDPETGRGFVSPA